MPPLLFYKQRAVTFAHDFRRCGRQKKRVMENDGETREESKNEDYFLF